VIEMKYPSSLIFKAYSAIKSYISQNPSGIRKRFEKEKDLDKAISDYTNEALSQAFLPYEMQDKVREMIKSSVLFGFVLREELAKAKGDVK